MSKFIPAGQGGTETDTEYAMRARVTELEAICVNLQQQAALHFEERQRLQARLAHVAAKSNRRRKALRELNNAMQIAHLMVSNQTYQKQRLFEKLREKPGILRRIWRKLW